MTSQIRVPEMGESLVEATVGQWLKGEGDAVAAGEPVVELETDKVNLSVSAEENGVLRRKLRAEGETVKAGDILGEIGESPPAERPAGPSAAVEPHGDGASAGTPPRAAPEGAGEMPARATPLARRKAASYGLDLAAIRGTGIDGRITEEDVERARSSVQPPGAPGPAAGASPAPSSAEAAPAGRPAPAALPARPEERIRLSARRRTIARRLTEAHQATVMTTTYNELDMLPVMELRRRRRESFRERFGVDLGLMPFFVKAVVAALHAYPQLNAELDGDELVLKRYYDIGIAVDAEEGLVVPVLRDAGKLSFAAIENAVRDLVARTRERRLTLEELQGGTFTITNGGVFGSLLSTPLLNPPQVGILGMHRIAERPAVVNGQVVPRPMMYAALTYDHRVVDGGTAVRFLVRVKELIEDPELLLLEG